VAGRAAPKTAASKTAAPKTAVAIPQLGWDRVRPANVVLVSGTEDFLAERAIRMLREILRAEDPSLEISDLEADAYGPGELITLASPSLFGEPRMIRVTGVEKCTDAFIAETLRYLESPADDTYLVLRHAGGVRGKKLLCRVEEGLGEARLRRGGVRDR
jgi:DNA polymerase-3 subunit delta